MRKRSASKKRCVRLRPHHPEAKFKVTGGLNRPPMERTPKIAALYTRAREVASRLGFTLEEASVGGGSDGNFAAAVGASVLDGIGALGEGSHAEHEHIIVDGLAERIGAGRRAAPLATLDLI